MREVSALNKSKAPGELFMILAVCEFFLFLGFMYAEGNENFRLMCVSGLILGGTTAVATACGMLFSLVREKMAARSAAVKALGKHGLKVMMKDQSARIAYKGILNLMQGRLVEAEELLQRSLSMSEVRQNQLFCVEWLIRIYEAQENDARMLWCFRRAAELAPDNPEVQSRLGHAYYADGKLSNAEHCFEQALKYDPNHGYSYYSLAKIYMVRGEDDRALETLKTLENIQPSHPLVNSELATWYAMHDDAQKAEEYYDKALLCGYKEPELLSKRMTALREFSHAEGATGSDLPQEYYRHIEKEDTDAGNV